MKKYLIGLSISLFALVSNAQFVNSGKLVEDNQHSTHGEMFAIGYILGVVDSYDGTAFCIPAQMTAGNLKEIIIEALEKNPHVNKKSAADMIFKGFSAAFPCQSSKAGSKLL